MHGRAGMKRVRAGLELEEHDLDSQPGRILVSVRAEHPKRSSLDPQLLPNLANQCLLGALAGLDLAAWELPLERVLPARRSLRDQNAVAIPGDTCDDAHGRILPASPRASGSALCLHVDRCSVAHVSKPSSKGAGGMGLPRGGTTPPDLHASASAPSKWDR